MATRDGSSKNEDRKKLLVTRIAKTIYDSLKNKSDLRSLVQNIDGADSTGNKGRLFDIYSLILFEFYLNLRFYIRKSGQLIISFPVW